MWAAWWLVEGYDGDGLRFLAGLPGDDPRDIRDALPAALADVGVEVPSIADACKFVFDDAAANLLAGITSEEAAVALVERVVIATSMDAAVWEQPLARIYGLDDEWGEGWGRPIPELRRAVHEACARQLRQTSDPSC